MTDIGELAGALAKAQKSFPKVEKRRTAKIVGPKGSYSYQYADLADVLDAVRGPLADNGLAVTQLVDADRGLVTRLMHSSGQFVEAIYPVAFNGTPQQIGAAITYARRYALSAIVGIASEDDTDAQGVAPQTKRSAASPPKPSGPETEPSERRPTPSVPASSDDASSENVLLADRALELAAELGIPPGDVTKSVRQRGWKETVDRLNAIKAERKTAKQERPAKGQGIGPVKEGETA